MIAGKARPLRSTRLPADKNALESHTDEIFAGLRWAFERDRRSAPDGTTWRATSVTSGLPR
jgi:hypothetical protein